jgi:hypothetical protein
LTSKSLSKRGNVTSSTPISPASVGTNDSLHCDKAPTLLNNHLTNNTDPDKNDYEDFHTRILKQQLNELKNENKNLQLTIQLIESDNKSLQDELSKLKNLKQNCIHCFPPLNTTSTINHPAWQTVTTPSYSHTTTTIENIECKNKFDVLSQETSSNGELISPKVNEGKLQKLSKNNNVNQQFSRKKASKVSISNKSRKKLVILADSHGSNLSSLIEERSILNVCSHVRPGAKFNQVVQEVTDLSKDLSKNDHLLVVAGTNNIEVTGIKRLVDDIHELISKVNHTNLILASIPMRHDKPNLDLKIARANAEIEKIVIDQGNIKLLPLHLLPRHYYTNHGLHFNKKGKISISRTVAQLVQNHKEETPKIPGFLNSCKNAINVVDADMGETIQQLRGVNSLAFSHSISGDFNDPKHMSAGVAVVFRHKFGRPQTTDLVNSHLACQTTLSGATVYGLVTKPTYNEKPTPDDYDTAFAQLTNDFKRKNLKTLICSPMGCTRDLIQPEHFAKNLIDFQNKTEATIYIVLREENSNRILRRGLSHAELLGRLSQLFEEHNNKLNLWQSARNQHDEESGHQSSSQNSSMVIGNAPATSSTGLPIPNSDISMPTPSEYSQQQKNMVISPTINLI